MGNLAVLSYNHIEKMLKVKTNFPDVKNYCGMGNMKITNFEPANQFVKRNYAGNWKLEL